MRGVKIFCLAKASGVFLSGKSSESQNLFLAYEPTLTINKPLRLFRNVLNLPDANTTEINPKTADPVVIEMPEHHTGVMGGTMRLGRRTTIVRSTSSVLSKLCLQLPLR